MELSEEFNPEETLNQILSIDNFSKVFPLLKKMDPEYASSIRSIISKRMYEKGEKIWNDFCQKVDDCCADKLLCHDLGIGERVRNEEAVKANILVYYCLYSHKDLKSAH